MIDIRPTDKLFITSPQVGRDCLCSRCEKPIFDMALRAWPDDGCKEYRYHFKCQGMVVSNNTFEDDDFDDIPDIENTVTL